MYDPSDNGEYVFKYLSKGDYVIDIVDKWMSGKPIFTDKAEYSTSTIPITIIVEKLIYSNIDLLMKIK